MKRYLESKGFKDLYVNEYKRLCKVVVRIYSEAEEDKFFTFLETASYKGIPLLNMPIRPSNNLDQIIASCQHHSNKNGNKNGNKNLAAFFFHNLFLLFHFLFRSVIFLSICFTKVYNKKPIESSLQIELKQNKLILKRTQFSFHFFCLLFLILI